MFKNFFFLKIEEWNRGHPFFFSCIIAQKKPKIQTHCGKWSWRINKKGFLMNFRCSQFFFKSERAEAVSVKGILEITARYWYQTGPITWLNMLRPKGKTLHCFCDNDLWQRRKKISLEHKQYSRGRVCLLRSRSFGSSRNTPVLMGRKRNKERAFFINNFIAKWRLGSWSIQGLPLSASNP